MKVIIEGEKRYIESILKANKGRIRRGLITVETIKQEPKQTIEEVRALYLEACSKEVSTRYKNNAEWMLEKIQETKK